MDVFESIALCSGVPQTGPEEIACQLSQPSPFQAFVVQIND